MRVPAATAVIVVCGFLAAALSACGGSGTNDAQPSPTPASEPTRTSLSQPSPTAFKSKVRTPIAQAREAGTTPYWLGDLIEEVGDDFRFTGNAFYGESINQLPDVELEYWQQGERPTLHVATYPPDETHDVGRLTWLSLKRSSSEPVELNGWSGEIISVLQDGGEFRLIILLRGENAAVRIRTMTFGASITSSPLSDPEQLLAIIEEHLRAFPE